MSGALVGTQMPSPTPVCGHMVRVDPCQRFWGLITLLSLALDFKTQHKVCVILILVSLKLKISLNFKMHFISIN